MARHAVFSEHDSEPLKGLPEALPAGEQVLWQGAPAWRGLALDAYRVRHWPFARKERGVFWR